jgi:hypothetical protein
MDRDEFLVFLHMKIRERLLYQEGKRHVLVVAKLKADFSLEVCKQENLSVDIGAQPSSGCSTVAVT